MNNEQNQKLGRFEMRFAWIPVRVWELTPKRADCFQFWKRAGWAWLRNVCRVEIFLTGDVVHSLPNR